MNEHIARELIEAIEALKESVDSLACAMDGEGIDFEPDFPMDDLEVN